MVEFKSFLSQNLVTEAPFPDEKAGYNCLSFYSFFSARNSDNNVPHSLNSAWICLLSSLTCFDCWQSCYVFCLSNNLHRPQLHAEVWRAQSPTSFVLSSIICNLKCMAFSHIKQTKKLLMSILLETEELLSHEDKSESLSKLQLKHWLDNVFYADKMLILLRMFLDAKSFSSCNSKQTKEQRLFQKCCQNCPNCWVTVFHSSDKTQETQLALPNTKEIHYFSFLCAYL